MCMDLRKLFMGMHQFLYSFSQTRFLRSRMKSVGHEHMLQCFPEWRCFLEQGLIIAQNFTL